jgi:hypothetical protein
MRYVTVAIRSLLGLIFLASGLNGFLHRFPNPAMLAAVSFFSALLHSHYMLPLLCTTEVVGGALLLFEIVGGCRRIYRLLRKNHLQPHAFRTLDSYRVSVKESAGC